MRFIKWLVIGLIAGSAASAWAFPTWMGVYGSYTTHNGSNPGVYTILMNQDYYGLHAEVGIGISNNWTTYSMTYVGNDSGNSIWTYSPGEVLATNTFVQYYFHGWDDWGGNIYANNYGNNYSFLTGPAELVWIGATEHKPTSPVAGQDITIWTETWPKGSGESGYSLFQIGTQWNEVGLSKTTSTNEHDLWTGTLGRFLPDVELDYLVAVEDGTETTHYDNNGGNYYSISVSTGAPLSYLGGAYHWPTNGALGPTNSLWMNLFVSPSQTLVNAFAEYAVNGWIWERAPMDFWQMDGTNEWWHIELGQMPPSSKVWYAFDAQDGEGSSYIRPTNGLPYYANVSGSSTDSDEDGLPDDWEDFWFGGLTNATASGNPDGDGLSGMPMDNWMESVMGSDPTYSNAITEITVLWKPSIPLQGGAIMISATSEVFNGLGLSSITASFSDGGNATLSAVAGGRFQNTVLLSETSTVCKITSLSGGGETDDNREVGWEIPIELVSGGAADTDEDGMPDAWELANGFDPFADDASGDADSDSLSNIEEYQRGTNPNSLDTDGDGTDDGTEVREGTNPLDVDPVAGINRNWLFYNNITNSSSTWELVPGLWQRFQMINDVSGTNTTFILAPMNAALDSNGVLDVELRVSYQRLPPETGNETIYYQGTFYTTTVVTAEQPFHGLPTLGAVTLQVFKVDWPQPPYPNQRTQVYVSPLIKSYTNTVETDYAYLVGTIPPGCMEEPFNGFNNWRQGPQHYFKCDGEPIGVDYAMIHDRQRLYNGGFETCSGNLTNIASWTSWGTNAAVSTQITHLTSLWAFVSFGWDGVLYQNIPVSPGEEIVVSGYMFTPAATNSIDPSPLQNAQRGKVSLELFNRDSQMIKLSESYITTNNAPDAWHYFAITSLVPEFAQSANVSLRVDDIGNGHVYYDDLSVVRSADTDQDGMPDHWEESFSDDLDSFDPNDSIQDADGDGIRNLSEFRYGTNPSTNDTDQDGISDLWEMAHQMDPNNPQDAHLDYDNDGLANVAEYILGSNPLNCDTDGDRLDDAFEHFDYQSDPCVSNSIDYTAVDSVFGSNVVNVLGEWEPIGEYIHAVSRRGHVEYQMTAPTNDIYGLELSVHDFFHVNPPGDFVLRVSIDGIGIGKINFTGGDGDNVSVLITPWLQSGSHLVQIYWDNSAEFESLAVDRLRLLQLPGVDDNADGIKDWVMNRLHRLNTIDHAPSQSYVSPAYIEGQVRFFDILSASSCLSTQRLPNNHWFADLALSPTSAVPCVVSFENGGLVETNVIQWVPLNILDANDQMVRKGDTLMMTARPEQYASGMVSLAISSVTNWQTDFNVPVTYCFDTAGCFEVVGSWQAEQGAVLTATVTVTVVEAQLGPSPACWVGYGRPWTCPTLSTDVYLDVDSRISLIELDPPSPGARRFEAEMFNNENRYVAARLYQGGPPLASVAFRGFHLLAGSQTHLWIDDELPDGTEKIGMIVVCSPMLEDLTFDVEIFVSGIWLETGGIYAAFAADDFNALGEYRVNFMRAPDVMTAVCHRLHAMQDGVVLGSK